ncbi:MAG: hypothetical protein HY360_00070 [Verrucomicrobia bacterium]|nr:hypothetical protein [Verrucomicrobiota bacterium]
MSDCIVELPIGGFNALLRYFVPIHAPEVQGSEGMHYLHPGLFPRLCSRQGGTLQTHHPTDFIHDKLHQQIQTSAQAA